MAFAWWPADRWPENTPDTLQELTLEYCVKHLTATLCAYEAHSGRLVLKSGVTLPPALSECLMVKWRDCRRRIDDAFLHIFKDTERTTLRTLNLEGSEVSDEALEWLLAHAPLDLNISSCAMLTEDAARVLSKSGRSLRGLRVGNATQIFQNFEHGSEDGEDSDMELDYIDAGSSPDSISRLLVGGGGGGGGHVMTLDSRSGAGCVGRGIDEDIRGGGGGGDGEDRDLTMFIDCPNLRALSIHNFPAKSILRMMLFPVARQLVHLDISGCQVELEHADYLSQLENLVTLIIFDVPMFAVSLVFSQIAKLKKLRVLDLGQSKEQPVKYLDPDRNLMELVRDLPKLCHLDLSGTNLPGFLKPTKPSHSLLPGTKTDTKEPASPAIPGLEGCHLEFLGLLNCPYDVCQRPNLPAKHVTGDADETQVILSIVTYLDKTDFLLRSLSNLFHLCKYAFQGMRQQRTALKAILAAMNRHPAETHVQISGSASLFYICKGEERFNFTSKVKQAVISVLVDAMERHMSEATMLRNGCLTLCHFKIPEDVLFDYQRVVSLLLKMVAPPQSEEFVQRIGIYLLNSLACQVDGNEKLLVGSLGAIETMLQLINERLHRKLCDEVMEIAWSTMWNVTDETPKNCERFIKGRGMDLFLRCLERFTDKEELLRNMMGLMGNVAEVAHLRPSLMRPEYVSVFSNLLLSVSDGIEVSYNACGVIAHLVTDGPRAWTIQRPTRTDVLRKMVDAISRWKLDSKRNINYRSFEPILRLIPQYETPEAQHWAVWALCNLTKMHRTKYCPLLEKENGLVLLEALVHDERPYKEIKVLSQQVLDRCRRFEADADDDSPSDAEGDMDDGAAAAGRMDG